MRIISFVHQKGGTGKSTLAVGTAVALAAGGARVLLLDTDYQGTSSDWGARFGAAHGVEVRSLVQPIVHRESARFAASADWLVIDGPPALSEMTESIARAGGRLIVPLRPSAPDIWALPWLAAIVRKVAAERVPVEPLAVFTQHRDEDVAPLAREVQGLGLPVHPAPIPAHPALVRLFAGDGLPPDLQALILAMAQGALRSPPR